MHELYDVIVVGAGPAGNYAAYKLASLGHNVAVFEERSMSALRACCTGIISTDCFHSLELSPEVILTRVNSAKFFSPSGRCLRLQTKNVEAYVVNRPLLDKALASKAQSQGAQYFYSSPVVDIIPGRDSVQVEALCSGAKEMFKARAIILANGFRPQLPARLGLGRIKTFLVGAQAEIEARDVDELEIYFGRGVAPGSFAWLVPTCVGTPTSRAYAGLLTASQAKLRLQKFLNTLSGQGRITTEDVQIEQKVVPITALTRTYGERVVVVGDAAGQVKPTTGGGIYFGHLGARIAAEVLHEALDTDNLTATQLSRYQKQWKAKLGKELSRGHWVRWAYATLTDRQIEVIFSALQSDGLASALVNSSDFSFDWHGKLILAVLKHTPAFPLLKVKHILTREVGL
ncbi:MAG: geranylgeranyl reductase family protein [Dehalococcoidia bacterium]